MGIFPIGIAKTALLFSKLIALRLIILFQFDLWTFKYAGVVPEISSDIDPSGRTDLLKIVDDAEASLYSDFAMIN